MQLNIVLDLYSVLHIQFNCLNLELIYFDYYYPDKYFPDIMANRNGNRVYYEDTLV